MIVYNVKTTLWADREYVFAFGVGVSHVVNLSLFIKCNYMFFILSLVFSLSLKSSFKFKRHFANWMAFAIIGHVKHNLAEEQQNETATGNKGNSNIPSLSLFPLPPTYPSLCPLQYHPISYCPWQSDKWSWIMKFRGIWRVQNCVHGARDEGRGRRDGERREEEGDCNVI